MLHKLFSNRGGSLDAGEAKLWSEFVTQNLTRQDNMPETVQPSPWYIKLMQTFAAWVASLFILAFSISFFNLFFDDLDTGFATIVGIFYSGFGILLYRLRAAKSLFVNQMALALSLCGLLSLGYGMTGWFADSLGENIGLAWYLTFGGILLLNWFWIGHASHQYVMSFAMIACLVGAGYELSLLELMPTLIMLLFAIVWLNHGKSGRHLARLSALGHMLALWVILIQLPLLANHSTASQSVLITGDNLPILATWTNVLSVVTTLIVLVILLVQILRSLPLSLSSKQAQISALAILLLAGLAIPMTGLSAAVLVIMLGFYVRERAVFFIGLTGLLSFIGWYYYSLQLPLLEKSLWLISLGALLILAKLLLTWLLPKLDKHGGEQHEG
ncbi:conserved hypothetical protein [Shewanella halifaxensis HAW-EB4]|uniref:DUF4401 domain-containing protein n=1 Tax=Shewanella halifaxensis (strain HAW-EB4) TaxID=458817 RepID=B0TJK5_SHEHH|nr:DUF4401 domain-containing protein [Shewanella halifaxensis]ABZ77001.1 conserved hypothetical protein [Shewanella halifaxensis HAW-EB4]